MSEKESLELITKMIRKTQNDWERGSGNMFLIWGYTTVLVTLLIFALLKITNNYYTHFLWFLIPIIGTPALFFLRGKRQRRTITLLSRAINETWLIIGGAAILAAIVSFFAFQGFPILFIEALIVNLGVAITGRLIQVKVITLAGILGILLSFALLFTQGYTQLLVFAAIFAVLMVIPGHVLNAMAARKVKEDSYV